MLPDKYPPQFNSLGFHHRPPDYTLTPDRSLVWKDLDLWFVVEGTGQVKAPEGTFQLEPGACFIMRGGKPYDIWLTNGGLLTAYYAHFDYLDTDGQPIPLEHLPSFPRFFRLLPRLSPLADLLHHAWTAHKAIPPDDNRAQSWFRVALMEVAEYDRAHPGGDSLQDAQAQRMRKLAERIEQIPEADYSVENLARQAGYNRTYFCRIFKQFIGISPQQFVVRARMRTARSLLTDSNYTIVEIARLSGYADVSFFSRHFKELNGITPTAFRNQGSA